MAKPTSSFEVLRSEWNERLRAEGLPDIESEDNPNGPANVRYWTPLDAEASATYFDQVRDYFRRVGSRLPPRDRKIIRLHSEGLPYSDIAQQAGLSKRSKKVVHNVIAAFRKRMVAAHRMGWRRGARGRESVQIAVRLDDTEAALLEGFAVRLGRTRSYTLRLLLIACGTTPSDRDRMAGIIAEIADSEGQ